MTVERSAPQAFVKPWGRLHTDPWYHNSISEERLGEVLFGRTIESDKSELLLKILFTDQPLSIQVHPDDAFASSLGLPRGKAEAWFILSATKDAKVAIGLKAPMSKTDLRAAIEDGSIADLIQWHKAEKGDCFSVPAGTIHAIGAGIVLAEIQQRSDATYRLFDYGRNRELHAELAVSASNPTPARAQVIPTRLDDDRVLLTTNSHFSLEKIELRSNIARQLKVKHESWLLIIEGDSAFGTSMGSVGDSFFIDEGSVSIQAGTVGVTVLIGYSGSSRDNVMLSSVRREAPEKFILHKGGKA